VRRLRELLGYRPRPSQTRAGQRVDNPGYTTSDTGRLRAIVQEETQDQSAVNVEVLSQLEIVSERVREYRNETRGFADKRDIKYIWTAIGFLLAAMVAVGGALFAMIRAIEHAPR
jgi:hypothetical protein